MYVNENITQTYIANIFNVDKSRIGQILKNANVKTSYRCGIKKKINKEQSESIKKDNRYAKDIAMDYGVHESTIYTIKKGKY